ncbi:MAG: YraN family protein [Marinilabiliaceae bacterium]
MAEHNDLGHEGEDYAAKLLEKEKGFVIIERNWHYRQKEIDIIAIDSGTLVFVEVKTRTSDSVPPSELVSYNKIRFLETAAEAYIRRKNYEGDARFDLVVLHKTHSGFKAEHIPNAFR